MEELGYTWEVGLLGGLGYVCDVWVFPRELCPTQTLEVLEPGGETGEPGRAGPELLAPSLPPGTPSIINVPSAFHRWLLGGQRVLKPGAFIPPSPGFLRWLLTPCRASLSCMPAYTHKP